MLMSGVAVVESLFWLAPVSRTVVMASVTRSVTTASVALGVVCAEHVTKTSIKVDAMQNNLGYILRDLVEISVGNIFMDYT